MESGDQREGPHQLLPLVCLSSCLCSLPLCDSPTLPTSNTQVPPALVFPPPHLTTHCPSSPLLITSPGLPLLLAFPCLYQDFLPGELCAGGRASVCLGIAGQSVGSRRKKGLAPAASGQPEGMSGPVEANISSGFCRGRGENGIN
jgi:hypothetical protein